jgi:hypothetical protein
MGGGLMQLVAYGAQDIYLTGNPQITFFKVVYRRHTNFSMETIEQNFSGDANIGTQENEASCTISRNGDLIHKIYLTADAVNHQISEGSKMIKEVELSIGGQKIDMYTQEWQDIWNELSTPSSKSIGLKSMTSDIGDGYHVGFTSNSSVKNIQIPLLFWFCRNPGLSLPLIALQYHEVKLNFIFNSISALGTSDANLNVVLYVDYIYLDTDERKRFAQVSHEYLIEQVQILETNDSKRNNLNLNHPVKEIIWTSISRKGDTDQTYGNAQLVLNGQDRFSKQPEEYFQLRQPFDYHTSIPHQNLPEAATYSEIHSKFSQVSLSTQLTGIDLCQANPTSLLDTEFAYGALVTNAAWAAATGGAAGTTFQDFGGASGAIAAENVLNLGVTAIDVIGDAGPFDRIVVYPKNLQTQESGSVAIPLKSTQFVLVIKSTSPYANQFKTGVTLEMTGKGDYWAGSDGHNLVYAQDTKSPLLVQVLKVIDVTGYVGTVLTASRGGFAPTSGTYKYIVLSGLLSKLDNLTGVNLTHEQQVKVSGPTLTISGLAIEGVDQDIHRQASTSHMVKKINVYSFALKPEEHQPSGSCNFSRIDTAHLITDHPLGFDYHIYAVNYNVLRIMSGMGGLAYSN